MEDIAERAGFTRGAFYANFTDKADLLLTLLDEQSRSRLAQLDDRLDAEPAEFGLAALAGWFEQTFTASSPLDVAVAEFTPVAIREPAHAARIQRRLHEVRDFVTVIVETEPGCDPGVAARIKRDLHDALALGPEVRLCPAGTLERPQGKAVRVVDRRPR